MKTKQNAVDLTDLAIGILVLGIVVTIGSSILVSVRDSTLTDLDTVSTVNEATTFEQAGDQLAVTWGKSVDACMNTTSGQTILAGNYTATLDDFGVFTVQNATTTEWEAVSCNYTTYDTTRADWALPNDAATGIAEYGNWFDIIVIVGIAGLILSLIFLAFGNRGGGQANQAY